MLKKFLKNAGIGGGSVLAYIASMWGLDHVDWSELITQSHQHEQAHDIVRQLLDERTILTCPQ